MDSALAPAIRAQLATLLGLGELELEALVDGTTIEYRLDAEGNLRPALVKPDQK